MKLLMCVLTTVLLLPSCSHFVAVSSTSIGFDVSGDVSSVPDHVNAGFRRREIVFEKPKQDRSESSIGAIDSTTTWNRGYAIRQTSATGTAAEIVAGDRTGGGKYSNGNTDTHHPVTSNPNKPLTFLTRTTFGISASLPSNNVQHSEFTLGYKRYIMTRVSQSLIGQEMPSTFSDVTVHGGITGTMTQNIVEGSIPRSHQLSNKRYVNSDPAQQENLQAGGVRIRQVFGIGHAIEKRLRKRNDQSLDNAKKQLNPTTP